MSVEKWVCAGTAQICVRVCAGPVQTHLQAGLDLAYVCVATVVFGFAPGRLEHTKYSFLTAAKCALHLRLCAGLAQTRLKADITLPVCIHCCFWICAGVVQMGRDTRHTGMTGKVLAHASTHTHRFTHMHAYVYAYTNTQHGLRVFERKLSCCNVSIYVFCYTTLSHTQNLPSQAKHIMQSKEATVWSNSQPSSLGPSQLSRLEVLETTQRQPNCRCEWEYIQFVCGRQRTSPWREPQQSQLIFAAAGNGGLQKLKPWHRQLTPTSDANKCLPASPFLGRVKCCYVLPAWMTHTFTL